MATKLQAPVAITDPVRKDVAEGKFTLSLPRCELRQCGTETPLILSGAGFVDQGADGDFTLRMFVTEKYDVRVGMNTLGFGLFTSGVIIPESSYYDLTATAQSGATWRAERQSVNPSFGVRTELRIPLTYLEKVDQLPRTTAVSVKRWFIPGEFELPWHVQSGARRDWRQDRFEFSDDSFAWALQQAEGGVDAMLTVRSQPLEPHAMHFMQALEMLLGRSAQPLMTGTVSHNERITRVYRRPKMDRSSLGPPLDLRHAEPGDAHRFLSCCLHQAEPPPTMEDQILVLYRFWWRILRAHQGDIENSSLVLSVAIEGVLKALFLSEHDADAEFCDLVDAAKPAIGRLDIDERVRSSISTSLKNAVTPKPQATMRRLREQGVLTDAHIKAWSRMRHKGAHGAMLQDDEGQSQRHFDRFFCCLDLFYRLLFTATRYKGGFIDYSTRGWPPSTFPPANGRSDPPPGGLEATAAPTGTLAG